MRVTPVDLIGGYEKDDAALWSSRDVVNWIPEIAEGGNRTRIKLASAPGLKLLGTVGDGPGRGLCNVSGRLYAVSGNTLYEVSNTYTGTSRGTIPGVGLVGMAYNQKGAGNQLIVTNGQAGYVWNTTTGSFGRITDAGFAGGHSPDFLDSYILVVDPFGRFVAHSNLADATDWNTLDRFQSEASPDRTVTQRVNQQEVVVFNQKTTEFFYNSGASTGTFKSKKIAIDRGCASRFGVVKIDNSLLWLGDDGIFYRLNGYSAQPISTGAIEKAIIGKNWSQCFTFTLESKHHKIAYWTFPDGGTFGYDVITGLWHRRESFGIARWRINCVTEWNGKWIAQDYVNGNLYEIDWDTPHENCEPLVRELITPILHDEQNKITVLRLDLLFDTGCEVVECETPAENVSVTLWGNQLSAGGIAIDADQTFNSEVELADNVGVLGYYSGGASFSYPPAEDPVTLDISTRTYTELETPIALTIGNPGPGLSYWWAPEAQTTEIPFGAHYVRVSYEVDSVVTFGYALVYNAEAV